jgi:hypothetical protein
MAAQKLLGLHRQKVAIEHCRRLHEGLGQRHGRQFDRKSAGLHHATLDVFRAIAKVRVAEIDVAPGIDDGDHRLAAEIGIVKATLAQPRPMTECAQVADAEPAMAAQLFGTFTFAHSCR